MLKLYADGSCAPKNPGPGGFAFRLEHADGTASEGWGSEPESTNNRMELLAAIHGMLVVPEGEAVELLCDSQYVLNGCSSWRKGWQTRGMKKADGEPVLNADLWLVLWSVVDRRKVTYTWVRGHDGNPGNERVDVLAKQAGKEQTNTVGPLPTAPTPTRAAAPVRNSPATAAAPAPSPAPAAPPNGQAVASGPDAALEGILVSLLAQKLSASMQVGVKVPYAETAKAISELLAKRGYRRAA